MNNIHKEDIWEAIKNSILCAFVGGIIALFTYAVLGILSCTGYACTCFTVLDREQSESIQEKLVWATTSLPKWLFVVFIVGGAIIGFVYKLSECRQQRGYDRDTQIEYAKLLERYASKKSSELCSYIMNGRIDQSFYKNEISGTLAAEDAQIIDKWIDSIKKKLLIQLKNKEFSLYTDIYGNKYFIVDDLPYIYERSSIVMGMIAVMDSSNSNTPFYTLTWEDHAYLDEVYGCIIANGFYVECPKLGGFKTMEGELIPEATGIGHIKCFIRA